MAQAITVTVDSRSARIALGRISAAQRRLARQWLYEKGEEILTASKEEVPVDTGTLRGTGHVASEANGDVIIIGYGGPAAQYAAAVHFNPRAGHTGGYSPMTSKNPYGRRYKTYSQVGKWFYLLDPFNRLTANLAAELAAVLRTGR